MCDIITPGKFHKISPDNHLLIFASLIMLLVHGKRHAQDPTPATVTARKVNIRNLGGDTVSNIQTNWSTVFLGAPDITQLSCIG